MNLLRNRGEYLRWVSSKEESDCRRELIPVPKRIADSGEAISMGYDIAWHNGSTHHRTTLTIRTCGNASEMNKLAHEL